MQVTSKISTGKTFTFDFDTLPQASKEAIIKYGAQRWINDRVNSTKKAKGLDGENDLNKLGQDFLNRLLEGNIGIQRESGLDERVLFMIEFIHEKKGTKKKDLKAAIKAQGQEAWLAKYEASDVLKKEFAKRKAAMNIALDFNIDDLI